MHDSDGIVRFSSSLAPSFGSFSTPNQRNRAKPAATSAMAAAPLLPLPNWLARPANFGRVVGSTVGVMDSVYVALSGPLEGEVSLPLAVPPVDAEPFPDGEADAEAVRVGL